MKKSIYLIMMMVLPLSINASQFVSLISPIKHEYTIGKIANEQIIPAPSILSTKLSASNSGSRDYFGLDSAISGDFIISGAYGEDGFGSSAGAAYVYQYKESDWVETKLKASDSLAGDQFGKKVGISGNAAIVGAQYAGIENYGAAYVYEYSNDTWNESKLTASDFEESVEYATAIDIDGSKAIVGAPLKGGVGAVYLYEKTGSLWEETKLIASDGKSNNRFGQSVSISGNIAVIGSSFDDDKNSNAGAIYIFEKENNEWKETKKLTVSDGAVNDHLGYSISIDNNIIVVGAPNKSVVGASYAFVKENNNWTEYKLKLDDTNSVVGFGNDVSVSGNLAIVGASKETGLAYRSGASYIFGFNGSSWNQKSKLEIEEGTYFGESVSISNGKAIVGSHKINIDGDLDAGALFVFNNE